MFLNINQPYDILNLPPANQTTCFSPNVGGEIINFLFFFNYFFHYFSYCSMFEFKIMGLEALLTTPSICYAVVA